MYCNTTIVYYNTVHPGGVSGGRGALPRGMILKIFYTLIFVLKNCVCILQLRVMRNTVRDAGVLAGVVHRTLQLQYNALMLPYNTRILH